jgi:valyl-tRNA synthetase
MPRDLPKTYDASSVEDAIYAEWENSGAFNPDRLPERNQQGAPYCIAMPPPNRTGTLHMGHATMLAIEDLLIRFHRMRGKKTLWIPGTDHAAIATQVKVEQKLIAEGMKDPRRELGREAFLEKVVAFAEESAATIRNQIRKMGSSCDWSRETYTLDEERSRAVNELFRMMYEDGIIERGYRVVNWDPQFQTTLSDDEVEYKETNARFLTFRYDDSFPIPISTTRPETKFGDTAVAVHPDDKRYKEFIGETFTPTFCGKQITVKVIADPAVDPNFGTGALGVTPAHSMIDAEMAEHHGLPTVEVIGKDARMTEAAGPDFAGLPTVEARTKIEAMLNAAGLLESVEEIPQNLPIAQRGGAPVEQLPMRQWFIRVNKSCKLRQDTLGKWKKGDEATLKVLMRHAVDSGAVTILPDRFRKIYFHWIDHLRDWCISRQIWFGHQIPVWYHAPVCIPKKGRESEVAQCRDLVVSDTKPVCEHCDAEYTRDPDTLDTWFSSGLWTFSTLGWPDQKEWEKNRGYHPTAVLETGYDILFFWVARMVLMSTYALGEVPFHDVYLHGLVRDEEGRKMSKSLGNVLDPLDLISKYGTDAVRLSLVIGTSPGQDVNLSEEKIKGFRNFTNKLWNIARFILMEIGDTGAGPSNGPASVEAKTLADRWILARLTDVTKNVVRKIAGYEFSSAGEELRDFTWNDLADWYLEIAKIEKGKEMILRHILETILKLWHPYMPFVTEHIWRTAGFEGRLITSSAPVLEFERSAGDFEALRTLITDMRRLRAEQGIEAAKQVEFAIVANEATTNLIHGNEAVVKHLVRASTVTVTAAIAPGWATAVSGASNIGLNVAGSIDTAKERAKLEKEMNEIAGYLSGLNAKLGNAEFVSKAPERVISGLKNKQAEAKTKLESLRKRLESLG